jgi:tetratricopeptide (TPR) repeat protein
MKTILSVVILLFTASPVLSAEPVFPLEGLYRKAQREFHRKNFEAALPLLKQYVEKSKKVRYKRERLFWVIDQIGRIYLREKRDPDGAIAFLKGLSDDPRFKDAELHAVEGWLSGAVEFKQLGRLPDKVRSADELFSRGEAFYKKGLALKKYPADDAGDAHFHIAAGYLVPFIVNFDKDARIGEALYMMGDIRRHSWTDSEYWSENYYLREAIRRFPHTELARRAYDLLEKDVRFGYTGSGGDHTPESLLQVLRHYQRLAEPK